MKSANSVQEVTKFIEYCIDNSTWLTFRIGKCYIMLNYVFDSKSSIWLGGVQVEKKSRGTGEATKALKMITAAADKLRVQINLFVQPMDKVTSTEGLVTMYKRFGFIQRKYDGWLYMVRKPKQKSRARPIESLSRRLSVARIDHVVVLV